jgi:hypothetical protein
MFKNISLQNFYYIGRIFLNQSKKPTKVVEKIFSEYELQIKQLYKKPLYWHGSGRYQYVFGKEKGIDVLEEIIKNNGLLPQMKFHYDDNIEGTKDSISLAKIRMYASIFAYVFESKEKFLQYKFGSRFFWLILIITTNFIYTPRNLLYLTFHYSYRKGKDRMKSVQSRAIKPEKIKDLKLFILQYLYLPFTKSDIYNNYPILIAVKKEELEIQKFEKSFDVFEARTKNIISFENISHIEVPFTAIEDTLLLFKKFNLKVEILPIEATEYFLYKSSSVKNLLTPLPD